MPRDTTSLPELFSLLLEAMRGVAAAHKQGVVHRDIKPDNIFLARRGDSARPVPKVLDFGSAGGAGGAAGGIAYDDAGSGAASSSPTQGASSRPDLAP